MLDNELQRTIYTLVPIKIKTVQYLRNRHCLDSDTDRIQHTQLPSKQTTWKLTLFTKIDALLKAEKIETKKPHKIPV